MDEFFVESWLNRGDHTVLGYRLRPFCLYYQLLLEVAESPLISGGAVEWIDLVIAAKICSSPWSEFAPIPKVGRFSVFARSLGRNIYDEADKFAEYVSDYYKPPRINPGQASAEGSQKGQPPEILFVLASVAALTGWSEEKIMMMPIGKAHWLAAAHLNDKVGLDFETDYHRKLFPHLRKMREKIQKEKQQNGDGTKPVQ